MIRSNYYYDLTAEVLVNRIRTYLHVVLDSNSDRQHIEDHRNVLGKLVKSLNFNNSMIVIAKHAMQVEVKNIGVVVYKENFISKPNQILISITQIQKYFSKCRPKRKEGSVFANFFLIYNEDIEKIILNIKY